jgi:hypothetical protein
MWRVLMMTCLAGLGLTGATSAQIRFGLPTGKAPVSIKEYEEGPALLTRFVLEGESQEAWTSALEVMELSKKGQPESAADWFAAYRASGDEHCPGATWAVVQQDKNSVLYERMTGECDGNPPQHSLSRVLYGKKQVFLLIFTTSGELSSEDRDLWITTLGKASAK